MIDKPIYIFDAYGTLLDLSAAARKVLSGHPDHCTQKFPVSRSYRCEGRPAAETATAVRALVSGDHGPEK